MVKALSVIAVLVAVLCAASALFLISGDDGEPPAGPPEYDPPVSHSITYHLDDGELPGDAPTVYLEGETMTLPRPEKDGMMFLGWYTDPSLSDPVVNLGPVAIGDVDVYASWGADPLGKAIIITGSKDGGSVFSADVTQTMEIIFGQDVDGYRPVGITLTTVTTSPFFVEDDESVTGGTYWLEGIMSSAIYCDEVMLGDKACTVWDVPSLGSVRFWIHQGYPVAFRTSVLTASDLTETTVEVHDIIYDVDPGIELKGYRPTQYSQGVYAPLPYPDATGLFKGWYIDGSVSDPLGAILPTTSGDLVLHADIDPSGLVDKGYTLSVSGTYQYRSSTGFLQPMTTTTVTISGTQSVMYLAESDGEYYVNSSYDMLYTSVVSNVFSTSTASESEAGSSGYWTDEQDSGRSYTYTGNQLIDGRVCEVWTSYGDDVTITICQYEGYLPVRMYYAYPEYTVTYSLSSEDANDGSFDLSSYVYASPGIEVSGMQDMVIGEAFTLVASGAGFDGWYADGVLLTDDPVLNVPRASPGIHYEARSDVPSVVFESFDPDLSGLDLDGDPGDWTVYDEDWNRVTVPGMGSGNFYVVDGCDPVPQVVRVSIAIRTVVFEWLYEGRSFDVSVDITDSEVLSVSENDPYDNDRAIYNKSAYVERYFTVDDNRMRQIANQLSAYRSSEGFTDQEFAEFVLCMVQTIDYITDPDSRQADEYFKYPVEYIHDGGGDCEDSSIFYATLMEMMGYEAGIVIFLDHCMAIVSIDGFSYGGQGTCQTITSGGVTYYLCETTALGWRVGATADQGDYGTDDIRYAYFV